MNLPQRIMLYPQTLLAYLRGVSRFNSGNFIGALTKFNRCLHHPDFNNEFIFSYYGQALCALGRLEEGHLFLNSAVEIYKSKSWSFENEYALNLAKNTLLALRHIQDYTNIYIDSSLFDNDLKLVSK